MLYSESKASNAAETITTSEMQIIAAEAKAAGSASPNQALAPLTLGIRRT
jgi:hypothetical protein